MPTALPTVAWAIVHLIFDSTASTTLQRSSGSKRVLQLIFETFQATRQQQTLNHWELIWTYTINTCKPIAYCITECNMYTRDFIQDISWILPDITWAISCCVFPFAVLGSQRFPDPSVRWKAWASECAPAVFNLSFAPTHMNALQTCADWWRLIETDWDWLRLMAWCRMAHLPVFPRLFHGSSIL